MEPARASSWSASGFLKSGGCILGGGGLAPSLRPLLVLHVLLVGEGVPSCNGVYICCSMRAMPGGMILSEA